MLLKLAIAALLKWPEAIEEWAVQTYKSAHMSGAEYTVAMVAVIRKFDRHQMTWMHDQISHKWQHRVCGPVVLMQALGMLNKDTDTAPEVLLLEDEGQEGTGPQVYGLLANHTDMWNRLVELADSTPTIALPQAKQEIEGFIVDMGEFLCRFPSSFGMGSMKHQHKPDPMKAYRHNHVLQKLVLLAPHWPEVHGFSASTSIQRAGARDEPPSTTQTPAASHTSVPCGQWRLTGTIWENMIMDGILALCPDTEKTNCVRPYLA
jgi:hypothetical protein